MGNINGLYSGTALKVWCVRIAVCCFLGSMDRLLLATRNLTRYVNIYQREHVFSLWNIQLLNCSILF